MRNRYGLNRTGKHSWKSDAGKLYRSAKKMRRLIERTETVVNYIKSLSYVRNIDETQFKCIVRIVEQFHKLFGCAYNTVGYDDASKMLEEVARLYDNLMFYNPYCEFMHNRFSCEDRKLRKICSLYGVNI